MTNARKYKKKFEILAIMKSNLNFRRIPSLSGQATGKVNEHRSKFDSKEHEIDGLFN